MSNLRIGKNQTRKVYGYIQPPKRLINAVVNNITKSFDAQSIIRHRDYFFLINDLLDTPNAVLPIFGEYDEDLISFNSVYFVTKSFNTTFTANPIVVVDVLSSDSGSINTFISNITTTGVVVETSAPFVGVIRYRAIYSATYPTTVQRNVLSSAFTYNASAGYITVNNSSTFTASYASLGSPPTEVFFTPYDVNSNGMANVAIVNSSSFGVTETSGDLSANIINQINFIAII
jgi:hypothetical protein